MAHSVNHDDPSSWLGQSITLSLLGILDATTLITTNYQLIIHLTQDQDHQSLTCLNNCLNAFPPLIILCVTNVELCMLNLNYSNFHSQFINYIFDIFPWRANNYE